MAIGLTDEMMEAINNALNDRAPCLVATASADGMPDVSYRGSVLSFDREHLAFWERVKGMTLENLEANPAICIFYRNPQTRAQWRFYGIATVLKDGPVREAIMERVHPFEIGQDPERTGYAVLIRVDLVRERSETIMQREP
jgi:predicted pyridoxine 5'-phosphate oxidase superfamily flavin-nucleotide-binding protein